MDRMNLESRPKLGVLLGVLMEHHPEIQWHYVSTQQVEAMSAADQKLYAELSYSRLSKSLCKLLLVR